MRLIGHPVLCNYYVTYRCNAKCSFCDIWEKPSPYVNLENVTANLKDLKKLGVKVIDFTGGEPLLHRQIHEFFALAKKMGFITTLTTNALLYPKYAAKLKGLVDMLHFSLDSPIAEEHDKSRGVACFDNLIKSIALAKEMGERPDILFTVHPGNMHHIKKVYEEITRPNNLVLILNPMFSYNQVGEELDEATLDALEQWGMKKLVYLNQGFIRLRRNGGNNIEDPACKAMSSTIVINAENKMVMPCYHLGMEELPIDNNLFEMRSSPQVRAQIKMEGRHQECAGCTVNCYMQPSFAVNINQYFWAALPSTLKYAWEKKVWPGSAVTA
jgi:MoaA/NifB/PqqE/SkfB family radical SAM enzyme